MLKTISKAKYPAISEQEEKDSLRPQTMCAVIVDAILVHMMNTVSPPETWQSIKKTLVESLNKRKNAITLQILESEYSGAHIIHTPRGGPKLYWQGQEQHTRRKVPHCRTKQHGPNP